MPWFTVTMIAACGVVYLGVQNKEIINRFAFYLSHPSLKAAFTYMFLHANDAHILFNMLYLASFGFAAESVYGSLLTGLTYFAAGLIGAFASVVLRGSIDMSVVGASAAVSGVIGLYIIGMRDGDSALVLLGVIPVRTSPLIALIPWLLVQIVATLIIMTSPYAVAVGFEAHMAGFMVGLAVGGIYRIIRVNKELKQKQQEKELLKEHSGIDFLFEEYTDDAEDFVEEERPKLPNLSSRHGWVGF